MQSEASYGQTLGSEQLLPERCARADLLQQWQGFAFGPAARERQKLVHRLPKAGVVDLSKRDLMSRTHIDARFVQAEVTCGRV